MTYMLSAVELAFALAVRFVHVGEFVDEPQG
jgi:hypothetical protein